MARSDAFRSRSPPFHSLNALTHATRPSPIAPSALHPTRQHLSIPPSSRLPAPTPSASSLRVPESSSTRRQTAMPSSTRYQMLSRPEGAGQQSAFASDDDARLIEGGRHGMRSSDADNFGALAIW
ncbi:hypothetical protein SCHPADRAFT_651828 [Schizopora paradoxa]|uniref:Uncharacterized protein n=1 Tax=Schizopora paradoxa TaxID=27342 RepID=A0A0H2R671_9AGAM|nr:hypothetical protein SCHPADRAFT_651828 [Schizopora paradoxa]